MVELEMQNAFKPTRVSGDVEDVGMTMNMAFANGRQFVMLQDENGDPMIVNMRNINVARVADDDAVIG